MSEESRQACMTKQYSETKYRSLSVDNYLQGSGRPATHYPSTLVLPIFSARCSASTSLASGCLATLANFSSVVDLPSTGVVRLLRLRRLLGLLLMASCRELRRSPLRRAYPRGQLPQVSRLRVHHLERSPKAIYRPQWDLAVPAVLGPAGLWRQADP